MEKHKILVVEDEVIVGIDLLKKIERLDYQAHPKVIRYGEHVEAVVKELEPDLILMDIYLKGEMDGTQAAAAVMKKYGIPTIFLTAFSDQATLSKAKKAAPYAYLKKPVRMDDLRITLEMALYKAKMEKKLQQKVEELEKALENIKTLEGLIPICAGCKKIRDDQGYWNQLESYIEKNSDAQFSHSICPECTEKLYGLEDWYIKEKKEDAS